MFKLFCLGCLVAVILAVAHRFALLAQGLSEAKLLPKSWRRWLYDTNHVKKTS
jgi:hypothetical protein